MLAGEAPAGYAWKLLRKKAAQDCLLVAADAGADRLAQLGLAPHVIVGDGDSISGSFPQARRVEYPQRKNFTDGQAALELALAETEGPVWLLGVLGGRPDHQLANLLLALSCAAPQRVRLAGADWQGRYLGPGCHLLEGRPGDTVSLLPLAPVSGLSLTGFEYPLRRHQARPGDSRTLSNVLAQSPARIELTDGLLLAFRILQGPELEEDDEYSEKKQQGDKK